MTNEKPDLSPISVYEEIFPGDTNAYGTAFGGKILAYMDRAAGLAASKYARCSFVTASLDSLEFRAPVKQGDIAEVEAKVVYVSRHTAGVKVIVSAVDKVGWKKRHCCSGIFFMVAMGAEGEPTEVPHFIPDNDEEWDDWRDVEEIHRDMLRRRRRKIKKKITDE
jgi:acyl-CoA hydrolase